MTYGIDIKGQDKWWQLLLSSRHFKREAYASLKRKDGWQTLQIDI
jgi:hypothetical protein